MPETLQNLDIQQPNPFTPETDLDSTDITPKKKAKNPKIIILVILIALIIFLLILSLLVSASKNIKKSPTATVTTTTSPTPTTASPDQTLIIPTAYQKQFEDLDKATQETVNFPLPQTDPSIGLTPNQ